MLTAFTKRKCHFYFTFLIFLAECLALGSSCSQEEQSPAGSPSKDQVSTWAKADGGIDALCNKYQLPPGCDLCDYFKWYGDGQCDQGLISEHICKKSDPDCPAEQVDAGINQDNGSIINDAAADMFQPPIQWAACDTSTWYSGKPYPAQGVECATFQVPLDHANPNGQTIPLRVARHKSKAFPSGKAIFQLAGGPGGSSVAQSGLISQLMPKLLDEFDLIYVDQRGTGGSGYMECPMNAPETGTPYIFWKEVYEGCAKFHANKDLNHYLSVDAAHDLDWVRQKLGYQKIYLRGGSYGTRLGLEYIRQHENNVAAAVLDGLDTPDWNSFTDTIKKVDREINTMIDDCNKDATCKSITPDLAGDLANRRETLQKTPRPVVANGTATVENELTYLAVLGAAVEDAYFRFHIPKAIRQSLNGDNKLWNQIMSAILGYTVTDPPAGSSSSPKLELHFINPWLSRPPIWGMMSYVADGLNFIINCAESVPNSEEPAALKTLLSQQTWGILSRMPDMAEACLASSNIVKPIDATLRRPVKSSVKVLLLSGEIDFVTPPEIGDHAAETLPNSTHLRIPYATHSVMSESSGCGAKIITDFFKADGDMTKVDTSCIKKIPSPGWN